MFSTWLKKTACKGLWNRKKKWNIFREDFTFLGELHKTAVKWVLRDEFVANSRTRQSEGLKRLWKRIHPTFVWGSPLNFLGGAFYLNSRCEKETNWKLEPDNVSLQNLHKQTKELLDLD